MTSINWLVRREGGRPYQLVTAAVPDLVLLIEGSKFALKSCVYLWSIQGCLVDMISIAVYRGENKGLFVLLSRTQAESGRTVKQEQEKISRNHGQTTNLYRLCQNCQRIGCVIPCCNLQRKITQPIPGLFLTYQYFPLCR